MNNMNRRDFLKGAALTAGAAALAACTPTAQPNTGQVVKETVVVEKAVQSTVVVEKEVEKVVTATPGVVDWLHAEDISAMPSTAIRYWFYESPERTELGQKQVEEFQKLFPNIKVLGRQAPRWTDNQALLAYIKAGTSSHIQQSMNNEDLWYIAHGVPLAADEMPGFQAVYDSITPKMNYQWEGKTWSLPWYYAGQAISYNKKLVEAAGLDPKNPPKTYSEFMGWAEALTIPGKQWFAAPTQGEEWWWWEFVLNPFYIAATGTADLLDKETKKPIFNNDGYAKVLQMWQDLFTKGYATYETFQTSPFLGGQVACDLPAFLGNHQGYRRDGPPDFEYFVGPIPKPDDSTVPGNKTFMQVRNLMLIKEIQKTGEEADRIMRASWEFERYLLSPAQAAADFEVSGEPPSQADFLTNPLYTNKAAELGPEFQWHAKYVLEEGMIGDLTSVKAVEYMDFQQKLYLNIIRSKMTPAEGLKWAEEETIKMLAQP
ncbi:MAG: extracellular solute-binding protein [Chloroflexota bacterium]|nr:MAG: extracellular solute-binding protein [Chloroflexota bacterium]